MSYELQVEKRRCSYCGEPIELVIDCSVDAQSYIEDCQVCCRPLQILVACEDSLIVSLDVRCSD